MLTRGNAYVNARIFSLPISLLIGNLNHSVLWRLLLASLAFTSLISSLLSNSQRIPYQRLVCVLGRPPPDGAVKTMQDHIQANCSVASLTAHSNWIYGNLVTHLLCGVSRCVTTSIHSGMLYSNIDMTWPLPQTGIADIDDLFLQMKSDHPGDRPTACEALSRLSRLVNSMPPESLLVPPITDPWPPVAGVKPGPRPLTQQTGSDPPLEIPQKF